MHKLSLFAISIFLLFPEINQATIVTSNGTGGGDWSDAATWNPAGVPGCVDTISILAGDVVEITSNQDYEACPPMVIQVYGNINFPDNGPKFRLSCDSYVQGFAGGSITAPGGDNSNKISICGTWVWESNEPDLVGPFELGVAPLPIELISFEAEIDNTSVKLTWKTASEINNDFFTIERSDNATSFEELAQIPGSGNSNNIREYQHYDDSPIMGTSYYRLKQTDFDGKYEYVKLIAINYNQDEDGICTLKVYPNPCVGSCTINLEDCPLADSQVDVELYDAFGKKIINRITPKSKDQDISFYLNSSNNLSPGVYIVKASTNGKNQSSKVVIK